MVGPGVALDLEATVISLLVERLIVRIVRRVTKWAS